VQHGAHGAVADHDLTCTELVEHRTDAVLRVPCVHRLASCSDSPRTRRHVTSGWRDRVARRSPIVDRQV
jgi:hypothetical protein